MDLKFQRKQTTTARQLLTTASNRSVREAGNETTNKIGLQCVQAKALHMILFLQDVQRTLDILKLAIPY